MIGIRCFIPSQGGVFWEKNSYFSVFRLKRLAIAHLSTDNRTQSDRRILPKTSTSNSPVRMSKLTFFKSAFLVATIVMIAQSSSLFASLTLNYKSLGNKYTFSSCADSAGRVPIERKDSELPGEFWKSGYLQSAMTGISVVNLTMSASGACIAPEWITLKIDRTCIDWFRFSDTLFWPTPFVRSLLKVPIQN